MPASTEKEHFKQVKHAVAHVYLTVLQDWTGITQKWGILTGIRPTKLLHRQMQKKTSTSIAQMITFLGALLGGIIGIIQGILALLMN